MMAGFPITINSLSGNGVVNVGGAFFDKSFNRIKNRLRLRWGKYRDGPANESIQYISIFKLSIL